MWAEQGGLRAAQGLASSFTCPGGHLPASELPSQTTSHPPGPGAAGSPSQVQSPAETRAPQGCLTALSRPVPCLSLASPKPRTPTLPSMAAGPLASGRSGRAAGKVSASNDPVRAGQVQVERGVSHGRVQAETWEGVSLSRGGEEMGPSGNRQEEPTPLGEAPGEAYTGQARLQAHPLPAWPAGSVLPFCCPQAQAHTGTIRVTVRLCEGRGGPSVLADPGPAPPGHRGVPGRARLLWAQAGPCSQATTGSSPSLPVSSSPSRTSGLAQDTSGNDGHGGQQGDQ